MIISAHFKILWHILTIAKVVFNFNLCYNRRYTFMTNQPVLKIFDEIAPPMIGPTGFCRRHRSYWRKKMASLLPQQIKSSCLISATGTGDQLLSLMKNSPRIHQAVASIWLKTCLKMGQKKLKAYEHQVTFKTASCYCHSLSRKHFNCATMSFGIRNIDNVPYVLERSIECCDLRPGADLEFLTSSK